MRIHEWNPLQAYQIHNTRTSSKQENKQEKEAALPPREAEDRLEISREAQAKSLSAAALGQAGGDRPYSSREARIEALRQQVQAGTYEVPATLVAQKMLQAIFRNS